MIAESSEGNAQGKLSPYLSPLAVWALAVGTSLGWGSVVVTCNTYLMQAGPLGTVLGMLIGAAIMVVIARNYHYMINHYPEAGGVYSYAKHVFGYDHGFMIAWFLILVYLAVYWANATSIPLFGRYFLGDLFTVGYLYTVFGYDVYAGEVALTMAAIVLFAFFCMRNKKAIAISMIVLVIVFTGGITVAFAVAMAGVGASGGTLDPLFLPDSPAIAQILFIASASPWAFVGFENISNSAEEFTFSRTKSFRILVFAIIVSTLLYIFVSLLATAAYPERYDSWYAYIADLGNLGGIEAVPAFYVAHHFMGNAGIFVMMAALLALVMTSLIGNMLALSRLVYALAKDEVIPRRFSLLNKFSVPQNAIMLVAAVSLVVPFVGRTAVGWIVDVTTIGATLVYGFVSATSMQVGRKNGSSAQTAVGAVGVVFATVMGLLLLIPGAAGNDSMAPESYILFVFWAVLGFVVFRIILHFDSLETRFGRSVIVWIALLALILVTAMLWMGQVDRAASSEATARIEQYIDGPEGAQASKAERDAFVESQIGKLQQSRALHTGAVIALLALSLSIMLSNIAFIRHREEEKEGLLGAARLVAYTDPLTRVKSKFAYVEYERNLNDKIYDGTIGDFAVVVCDVNGLKEYNDLYGHNAGDELIKSASHIVCTLFDHSPVFRVGGDEFVVVLQGEDFENRRELMDEFAAMMEDNAHHGKVVVAAGLADYSPDRDKSVRYVFDRADSFMYLRKQALKSEQADSASESDSSEKPAVRGASGGEGA